MANMLVLSKTKQKRYRGLASIPSSMSLVSSHRQLVCDQTTRSYDWYAFARKLSMNGRFIFSIVSRVLLLLLAPTPTPPLFPFVASAMRSAIEACSMLFRLKSNSVWSRSSTMRGLPSLGGWMMFTAVDSVNFLRFCPVATWSSHSSLPALKSSSKSSKTSGRLSWSSGSTKMSFSAVPMRIKLCLMIIDSDAFVMALDFGLRSDRRTSSVTFAFERVTSPTSFCRLGKTLVFSEIMCLTWAMFVVGGRSWSSIFSFPHLAISVTVKEVAMLELELQLELQLELESELQLQLLLVGSAMATSARAIVSPFEAAPASAFVDNDSDSIV
mmetsp:Transcript_24521/g.67707  ORF Transcript_24521/g.67707 Transcript_24521/m.67707 type:complete len:327 (+) Transcript_24521:664-1644(+)